MFVNYFLIPFLWTVTKRSNLEQTWPYNQFWKMVSTWLPVCGWVNVSQLITSFTFCLSMWCFFLKFTYVKMKELVKLTYSNLIDFDLNTFYCPFIGVVTPSKKRQYICLRLTFSIPSVWYVLLQFLLRTPLVNLLYI